MKKLLAITVLVLASAAAQADVYVPYGTWTALPNCGGATRLICNGPRQANACNVEFRNSYNCNTIKLYVGGDFYPTSNTYQDSLKGSFWVDNAKIGWFTASFRAFLDVNNQGTGNTYERITYQFAY